MIRGAHLKKNWQVFVGGGRGRPVGGGASGGSRGGGGDRDDPPLEFVPILKTYGKCA